MTRGIGVAAAAVAVVAGLAVAADGPTKPASATAPAVPRDFKLNIEMFGVRKAPVETAQVVVRRGVAYQFLSDLPEEVVVVDPANALVVLIDLQRRIQAEVSSRRLDANLGRMHRRLADRVDRLLKTGTRADRILGSIYRDLVDPEFKTSGDAASGKFRLANETVEVDATGEPEPDAARLAAIANALAAVAKLGALRDPDGLPPFTRLDALRQVAAVHRLRPTELNFLYRIPGPPQRLRWTYRLVPELTDREVEALSRIEHLRATARVVPYELYEEDDEPE